MEVRVAFHAGRQRAAAGRYESLAFLAEAAQEARSKMTATAPAVLLPHANVVAAQALGSSSGR
jgi:hypothetical protein